MRSVLITGGGIAACACAALLRRAGHRVCVERPERPAAPVLLLTEQTQRLLADIFTSESLLRDALPVTRRIVAWGGRDPIELPHSGLVIPEQLLLSRLWDSILSEPARSYDATVSCSPRSPQHSFGSRVAYSSKVRLHPSAPADACLVEATAHGWLFLIPTGSLLAVGAPRAELLKQSSLIAGHIDCLGEVGGSFMASPRIARPLCGPSWIACGGGAAGFDPISGEGLGHALRQAILASAIIASALPEAELQDHYTSRIYKGLWRHLDECTRYYQPETGPWWRAQHTSLLEGQAWLKDKILTIPPERLRLEGFELRSM